MERFMETALAQARLSLREGNNGFGAVIVKDGQVVAAARDTEETDQDPTAHAEMNAIRKASGVLGKDLSGCTLVATHEPCPMCAAAIAWAKISRVGFGYGIADAMAQGRRRIGIPCKEIFDRADAGINLVQGVMRDECGVLYNRLVRQEIKKLRNATREDLVRYNEDSALKRLEWFHTKGFPTGKSIPEKLAAAHQLLLERFGITEDQAPIVEKDDNKIVFHSKNFCPTLEACKILDLDTRFICRHYNEESTDRLVKQIDERLHFSRNYNRLRPYSGYCEEFINWES